MIWQNLIFIPIVIFTLTFIYNAVLGITEIFNKLSLKTRASAIQKLVWTQFLFGCYNFCFMTWNSKTMRVWVLNLLDLVQVEGILRPEAPKVFTFGHMEGWKSFVINSQTSHTICAFLGITACFGIVQTVKMIGKRYKMMGDGAKEIIHTLLDLIFHIEFFMGTFLWFKYCFVTVFVDDASQSFQISFTDALNLAVTHTLAFSLGVFIATDFRLRTNTSQESRVVKYYSLCALATLILCFGCQTFSMVYDIPAPNDLIVVCLISIAVFSLLPSKLLMYYAIPPTVALLVAIGREVTIPDFSKYNSLGFTVLGILLGVYFSKSSAAKPELIEDITHLNGDRRRRAWAYPPPFPNGWYRIAGSEEVQPGQVKQVVCLGRQFAVFRGKNSEKITVADAFCPHLGANLALGGKVVDDTLQCPFHEWRFDQSGKCTLIPDVENIPEAAKVKVWPVHEYMGNIYFWWDAENRPPAYFPLADCSFDKGNMHYYGETQGPMYLHPQDVAENSADFAHFGIVHGKLHVPLLSEFTYIKHSIDVVKDSATPHILQFKNKALIYSVFNDDGPFLPDNTSTQVTILGPSTIMYFRVFTPLGYVLIIKTFLPQRALECVMTDRFYAEKSVPSLLAHYIFREAKYAFKEDGVIWDHKTYPRNPILIKDDKPIREFRRWYSQFYSPNSRRAAMGPNAVEYEESKPLIQTKREDVVLGCPANSGLDW